ncbi:sodium/hydrogen exchanger 8 /H(+) exchanger 8 [Pyrenophora tritici-repentis Pt-1C-BFP]|uniref:Sodium/hydrogen exchanger n=1 Tax=Pyrenophora tritici-repentis (strain Pt-1C-BFP) TaxID=426418 RepID=B2VVS7_PYRTR|nr:sodium/hydrogen exchanger 8 /H(+) exchanger 8 [Pyrenophora tritici-repentis Pt-1C-BFP]EDU40727.1 sodium/hydrogen exchanger 8 /H(+) exchanger 8 [Pyrenophora tritici-repentis Pt-1C-BFP]
MASIMGWWAIGELLKRDASDADPDDEPEAGQKEIFTSWALSILIILLIIALFTSYILHTRKIQAVHETVLSIFAGMVVGLILRLSAPASVRDAGNFFRHIGTILTFAFAGTFISALVLGLILFLWTRIPLDGFKINFVEAMSVGATLSATDPVTILAIFDTYKVEPKLYTLIFGESILNDAVAIVLFETAQKYKDGAESLGLVSLFEAFGIFFGVFFGSLFIGVTVGIAVSLMLKFTYVRRFPKTESCLIILTAYLTYFLSNAIHMSGIVSLLFCGICLKHYAYHNMSRRTQLTTKFVFQITSQISENFIFIYLGLSLFTDDKLDYKPLFILITVAGICAARWCAVFPLSRIINAVTRYRQRRRGEELVEEIPWAHQAMIYWAGLRGAVGVALAAGLTGNNGDTLRATVLVVVVLTVIIFGGTTARMLEILGIRTGVVEEIDSDDEFDIEVVTGGTYTRKQGQGYGHTPRPSQNGFTLNNVNGADATYSSGSINRASPPIRPNGATRRNSSHPRARDGADQSLLSPADSGSADEDDIDLDLPPSARRSPNRIPSPMVANDGSPYPTSGHRPSGSASANDGGGGPSRVATATGAVKQLFNEISHDPANAFKQIDDGFLKPHLLLDPGKGPGPGNV